MNWKTISIQVGLVLLTLGAAHCYIRMGEQKRSELLEKEVEARRAKSSMPMHHPPIQRDIIALAEKDSAAFCHPRDGSADGCRLNAIFMDDQWIVFCCALYREFGDRVLCSR